MAEPTALLAAADQITVEQDLDGIQVTVATPGVRRLMMLQGLLILGVAGTGLWGALYGGPVALIIAVLGLVLSLPLVIVLGVYLHPRLYEARIAAGQLTLQAATLTTLTVPLDRIVDATITDGELCLRHTASGAEQRSRFSIPTAAAPLAQLILDAAEHAAPSGDAAEIPAELAAIQRQSS